jgi:hypothetical protein
MPIDSATASLPPEDVSALLGLGHALAESLNLDVVLQASVESAVSILHLDAGMILLVDDGALQLGASTPPLQKEAAEALRGAPLLSDHQHLREAIDTQQPVAVANIAAAEFTSGERAQIDALGLRSALYAPLIARGRTVGAMLLGTTAEAREFDGHELALCAALSAQIAVAVSNARLFEAARLASSELRGAYDATVQAWSSAMELLDAEPRGHTDRAAALTLELAGKLGMPESELNDVRRGALLHDIGKMGVPDAILTKPGPLTDEEWDVMRKHPDYAREILSGIDLLRPALDIPYCHHERWNGTGYPQGLKGEEIPLSARIFAVIDVFDALTTDRPFRKAWTEADAIGHIELQAGIHFDPRVVAVFVERFAPSDV